MKRYVKCESQKSGDKKQYIFDFITQGDTELDSIKDQLLPNIRVWIGQVSAGCDTVHLTLPKELKDYLKYNRPFKKRNQVALQDFARTLFRWSGASTPAIKIFVDIGCSIYYVHPLDMILVPIDWDGNDIIGYWTKYLITANNTNEFIIGFRKPDMFSSRLMSNPCKTGYVKKNGSTILQDPIPEKSWRHDNFYIALGLGGGWNPYIIDFLEDHSCFKY